MAARRRAGPAEQASPGWLARLEAPPGAGDLPHIRKPEHWDRYRYAFVTGHLPSEAFPDRAWLRSLREALRGEHRRFSLQDAIDVDDPLLTELVCREILAGRGIAASPERVLITVGSQQGLHLVAGALVGEGSRVLVENPGYPDARHILARAGAELVPGEVDDGGLIVDERLLDVALAVTTPAHHYPSNVTMTGRRRQRLVALARERDIVLVEDDYDSELRFVGRASPALASLDPDAVIYLGSFSKFLAPGLRLGFVSAHPALIEHLRDLRRYTIRHPSGHQQRALALLIASGEYRRGVRHLREAMRVRWERTVAAVRLHLPDWVMRPRAGGVSVWIGGPPGLDTRELAARLDPRGVLIEPGDTFFFDSPGSARGPIPRHWIKLGFGALDPERIDEGVAIIADEARQLLG
ncbi:aminotransferase-like domain-containing protein [Actinomadura rupiterrae]|uniref:aminotransferase-like domain-containing protein n=1 Tax=Actinomadura rupiterrae TaxID=559627 RepID=UPI0020A24B5F|nr:PLP-dependent aminotransferase family protein [Actinomadura rupiterrae]MCP2343553.1 GntR family transcriptional regulator/MocR family aminotransferase [Actinomadura rupiterrae]